MFGWRYIVGGYQKGAATFNAKPLLPNARSTFLFPAGRLGLLPAILLLLSMMGTFEGC